MNLNPDMLRDVIYMTAIIGGAVATFFTTKHELKDYFRDRLEKLKDDVNDLKIENERLKSKIARQKIVTQELKESIIFKYHLLEQANNKRS